MGYSSESIANAMNRSLVFKENNPGIILKSTDTENKIRLIDINQKGFYKISISSKYFTLIFEIAQNRVLSYQNIISEDLLKDPLNIDKYDAYNNNDNKFVNIEGYLIHGFDVYIREKIKNKENNAEVYLSFSYNNISASSDLEIPVIINIDYYGSYLVYTFNKIDYSELESKYNEFAGLNLDKKNYTAATWAPFANALKLAENLIINSIAKNQIEVDEVLLTLIKTHDNLQLIFDDENLRTTYDDVNKTYNENKITLKNDNKYYTPSTESAFLEVLEKAKTILDLITKAKSEETDLTDEDINNLKKINNSLLDTLAAELKQKFDELVYIDYSDLVNAIADYNNKGLNPLDYTIEYWEIFNETLSNAILFIENPAAETQDEILGEVEKLNKAYTDLISINYIQLNQQIKTYNEYNLDESKFLESSWGEYQTALENATIFAENRTAKSQEEIDNVSLELKNAYDNLDSLEDFTQLNNLLKEIDDENLNENDYNINYWNEFSVILQYSKDLSAAKNASGQEVVDDAYNSLNESFIQLKSVNFSALNSTVESITTECENIISTDYTSETWDPFNNYLTIAQEILIERTIENQNELDELVNNLNLSFDNLILKPVDYSILETEISKISTEDLNSELYEINSWNKLQEEIVIAQNFANDKSAEKQSEVDAVLNSLKNARLDLFQIYEYKDVDITVGTYNIKGHRSNIDEIIKEIKLELTPIYGYTEPDIVGLQEVKNEQQLNKIANETGYKNYHFFNIGENYFKPNFKNETFVTYGLDDMSDFYMTYSENLLSANRKNSSGECSHISTTQFEINENTEYEYTVDVHSNTTNKYGGLPFAINPAGNIYFVYGAFNNVNDSSNDYSNYSYAITCRSTFNNKFPSTTNATASKYFKKLRLTASNITVNTSEGETLIKSAYFSKIKIVYSGLTAKVMGLNTSDEFVQIGDSVTLESGSKIAFGLYSRDGSESSNRTLTIKDAVITAKNDAAKNIMMSSNNENVFTNNGLGILSKYDFKEASGTTKNPRIFVLNNGFQVGYAQILIKNKVTNFYVCEMNKDYSIRVKEIEGLAARLNKNSNYIVIGDFGTDNFAGEEFEFAGINNLGLANDYPFYNTIDGMEDGLTYPDNIFYHKNAFSFKGFTRGSGVYGNDKNPSNHFFCISKFNVTGLVELCSYKASEGLDIRLHSSGEYYGVYGLGSCADKNIIIPDVYEDPETGIKLFVKTISGFSGAVIDSIVLGKNITKISANAFKNNGRLKNIILNENLKYIGEDAFYGAHLELVYFDGEIENWFNITFANTSSNPISRVKYGLYTKDSSKGNNAYYLVKNLVVPNSVTKIQYSAFEDYEFLESVKFSESVKIIEASAFWRCRNLETIEFSEGLIEIKDAAFPYIEKLKEINLPDSLEKIGWIAFDNCTSVTQLNIGRCLNEFENSFTRFI